MDEVRLEEKSGRFQASESYSPKNYDFRDLKLHSKIDTNQNWVLRKELCLNNVYTNLEKLINDSKAPNNLSLATFKPTSIDKLEI